MLNKLTFANLGHRPVRTLLSILAIAVEVTMILTLVGVSNGTLHESARRARGTGADILVRPPGTSALSTVSSSPMSDKLVDVFRAEPHIVMVTGTIVQPLELFDTLTGLNMDEFAKMSGGFRFVQGGLPVQDTDLIIDEPYAREKHLQVGSTLKLISQEWHVSGIYEPGKLARICARLEALQRFTANTHRLSQIYLKVDDPNQAQAIVDSLRAKYPGYQIYTLEYYTSLLSVNSLGLLRNFTYVVIGIAMIVGFIVVFMAMYTAVLERTREIGILKAVGSSSGLILNMLLRETLLLAVIGTVGGILLTYLTQWLMVHFAPGGMTQETVYKWWPITGVIAIAGSLIGAIIPGIKAVRQDATEALSYE
ncbi:ABC transporter permease [Terriglobus saanensis]|uniref:ABC transporter permease n=1 Tax=Terriglobus saanensis TaxID=870903 RepID=UPI0011869EAC|nr:FtsX-like permease family protein [Terriglobus saanensis]